MLRAPQLFDGLDEEPFPHPVKLGASHYVPFLKTKRGELDALANIPLAVRERLTPFLDVEIEGEGTGEPPGRSRLPGLPRQFQMILGLAPFFLDCGSMVEGQLLKVGAQASRVTVPAAEFLLAECERLRLNFIPVLRPGAGAALADLVKRTTDRGRGACLRLPVGHGAFQLNGLRATAETMRAALDTDTELTDLILDLGYIPPDVGFGPRHLAKTLGSLQAGAQWRSIILAGTVIPETLAGYGRDVTRVLVRHEWRLWNDLRQFETVRMPAFGDYGVQNPQRLRGFGTKMTGNLRYSSVDSVVIIRGRPLVEDRTQYRQLSRLLVARPEFRGSRYSWGDLRFQQCADGVGEVGTQTDWRGAGTSHHIHTMVEEFALRRERSQMERGTVGRELFTSYSDESDDTEDET